MNGANDACKNEHVPSCYYADIQHPPVVKKKGKKQVLLAYHQPQKSCKRAREPPRNLAVASQNVCVEVQEKRGVA
jgi:hypothetical protein